MGVGVGRLMVGKAGEGRVVAWRGIFFFSLFLWGEWGRVGDGRDIGVYK